MSKVKAFIGSSGSSLNVSQKIKEELEKNNIETTIWNEIGVFDPSSITINALISTLREFDIAIFIGKYEDFVNNSKNEEYYTIRDNVMLEFGLAVGLLGQGRVFLYTEKDRYYLRTDKFPNGEKIQNYLPSDLSGVTRLIYNESFNSIELLDSISRNLKVVNAIYNQGDFTLLPKDPLSITTTFLPYHFFPHNWNLNYNKTFESFNISPNGLYKITSGPGFKINNTHSLIVRVLGYDSTHLQLLKLKTDGKIHSIENLEVVQPQYEYKGVGTHPATHIEDSMIKGQETFVLHYKRSQT